MGVYVAVAILLEQISYIIERVDVLLPPPSLKILNFFEKELRNFRNFVERMGSKSRERMGASLEAISCTVYEYIDEDVFLYDMNKILGEGFHEDLSRGILSLVEQLKKVEDEYCTLQDDEKDVVSKSKMVGLADQRRQLKDGLIATQTTTVCSIFGMAGIGKTTLAREIYEDLDVIEWFDCRAWVTTGFLWIEGDEWKTKEITEAILAQVDREAYEMVIGGSAEELSEKLKECLKDKRYLIVMDDVWNGSIEAYLKTSFPSNQDGSRVVLTTRLKHVGILVSLGNSIDMRLLDKEESWDLLRQKVFVGVSCPSHLEDDGKKIAEKCDGLPLTIVTIAGFLSEASESLWIDVATKKKHKLFVDAYDQMSQVLNPSYEILDDVMKISFLYMGVFPLKYEIPKTKLINLWVAEKFVETISPNETLEKIAAFDLSFLAICSLVMIQQKTISGMINFFDLHIKTCCLHSSWSHFCQTKARETGLFHVLDCYNKDDIEKVIEGHTRLSIHNNNLLALKHVYNSIEKMCASSARSLLCLGPYCQYMVPVCFGLKFLRRLDALNIRFYDFPLEVLKLVELIFLALTCNGSLSPFISNLQKLEYLIVHPHLSIKPCGVLFNLPTEIWDMKKLKHLKVTGYDLPNLGDTSLEELITLSDVTAQSCMVLDRARNLKKLGIKIELAPNATDPLCCFDHISHLTKLKSLNCVIVNPGFEFAVVSPISSFPCLPFCLKKLSLTGMGYPWEEMNKIASLSNLKVFKLRCNAFRGPNWELEENGFSNLEALLIEDIDLVKLKWAHGSFKSLKVLRIKHCYKLKELQFGNLPHIIEIEVDDCSTLTEWHVKNTAAKYLKVERMFVRSSWKL